MAITQADGVKAGETLTFEFQVGGGTYRATVPAAADADTTAAIATLLESATITEVAAGTFAGGAASAIDASKFSITANGGAVAISYDDTSATDLTGTTSTISGGSFALSVADRGETRL
jgi:hypothetical protein